MTNYSSSRNVFQLQFQFGTYNESSHIHLSSIRPIISVSVGVSIGSRILPVECGWWVIDQSNLIYLYGLLQVHSHPRLMPALSLESPVARLR